MDLDFKPAKEDKISSTNPIDDFVAEKV